MKRDIYFELQEPRREYVAAGLLEAVEMLDARFPEAGIDIVFIVRHSAHANQKPSKRYLHRWQTGQARSWGRRSPQSVRVSRPKGEEILAALPQHEGISYELEVVHPRKYPLEVQGPKLAVSQITLGHRKDP